MAIKHSITLSTTEPNNEVGVIKIRQADEQTQTLDVQTTANGVPKSYQGFDVYFCAKLGQTAGLGIIEQKLKIEELTDPVNGKLEYTMRAEDWQILGRQKGYFSFRKMKDEHEFVEQFTTRDFTFDVIKSVYSDGLKEVKKDGSTYVWTIEDLIRLFNEYIASGKSDWEEFVEQNREILESVDPGGEMLIKINKMEKQINKAALDVTIFGGHWDGIGDDTQAVKNAVDYAKAHNIRKLSFPPIVNFTDIIKFDTDFDNGVELDLKGTKVIWHNTQKNINPDAYTRTNGIFSFEGDFVAETQILKYETYQPTHDISFYGKYGLLKVTNAAILNIGDYVEIILPHKIQTYNDYFPGIEILAKVVDIDYSNNKVYTDYHSPLNFDEYSYTSDDVLKKIKPLQNIRVSGGEIVDKSELFNTNKNGTLTPDARRKAVSMLGFKRVAHVTIEDVSGEHNKFPMVMVDGGYNLRLSNIDTRNADAIGGGEGYGVQLLRSYKIDATGLTGDKIRHLIDFSASAYATVKNSACETSIESAFDCHGMFEHDITFDNCRGSVVVGNGINGFAMIFGAINFVNCEGHLTLTHSSDVTIDRCKFTITDMFSEGDIAIRDSELIFTFYTQFEKRKRNKKIISTNLKIDNVIIGAWQEYQAITLNRIRLFDNVEITNTQVDFDDKSHLITFNDVANLHINNVNRVNTTFFYGTTQPIDINYKLEKMSTTLSSDYRLSATYAEIDRMYQLNHAKGVVSYQNNKIKYNASSASNPIRVIPITTDASSFLGSTIDFYIDDNTFEVDTSSKMTIPINVKPGVQVFASGNHVDTKVIESGLKLTKNSRVSLYEQRAIAITPENGWSDGGYVTGFQKSQDGVVYFYGILTGGSYSTQGVTMFTLPVGFRPKMELITPVMAYDKDGKTNGIDRLKIGTDGQVKIISSAADGAVFIGNTSFIVN